MKEVDIYQTLEDRQNDQDVEEHGPYFCSSVDADGNPKSGVREPWLGEGYYFWDSRIANAMWWGDTVYSSKGYIICHTTYDQHSPLLFDMVGDVTQLDDFVKCAEFIKKQNKVAGVSFPVVIAYMKKLPEFYYKAIRVCPHPKTINEVVRFPGSKSVLCMADKIQICFFDKTLLNHPFKIVHRGVSTANQTI